MTARLPACGSAEGSSAMTCDIIEGESSCQTIVVLFWEYIVFVTALLYLVALCLGSARSPSLVSSPCSPSPAGNITKRQEFTLDVMKEIEDSRAPQARALLHSYGDATSMLGGAGYGLL